MSLALDTDLYELRMAASYLRRGMTAPATFSLFVRRLPPGRSFLVTTGLEACLDYLESLSFTSEDLDHLGRQGFDTPALEALAALRFTGDVQAVPEGRVVLANEPLLEVSAPLPEAQLVETALLSLVTFPTAVTSKAARCRLAAADRIELVEFGMRRAQGAVAAFSAARAAAIVGFAGTSNVEAARELGMAAVGTMAHSYIEAFPDELAAFRAFAEDFPARTVFLVDTFDTLAGVARAVEVIKELGLRQASIRLDSGDLAELARGARQLLDKAELPDVRIFASGNLDEFELARLVEVGAPIDAAGVGTLLAVSADAPYLESVYKLVAVDKRFVRKLSPGKVSLPGPKQVWRAAGRPDVLGLRGEDGPNGAEPLLVSVMAGGKRLEPRRAPRQKILEARQRFEHDLAELPAEMQRIEGDSAFEPLLSERLAELADPV